MSKEKYTIEKALEIAKEYGLEWEVEQEIKKGHSPEEALYEWDLL